MSLIENIVSKVKPRDPRGTIYVVDRSPLNWLYITYNTVEELVRTDEKGHVVPAAMESYKWVDDLTLEVYLRPNKFQSGEPLTARNVKQSFDEMQKRQAPHPPGTQFNLYPGTRMEVVDETTVRYHLPKPDGMVFGKMRAMHLMNPLFWDTIGFGYTRRDKTGEGHW